MEENDDSKKIRELVLQFLPKQFFPQNVDKNVMNLRHYYESLDYGYSLNKVCVRFFLKLIDEKNISISKFESVVVTLENSEKLYEASDNDDDTIKSLKNINLYNKINNVIKSLNADTCYSYLIYQYLDIFGENSKNFQEIFQIIISSIYHQNIKCDFTFDFDENYYNNVINFINSLQNEMNNKLYYEELYKSNNISTKPLKKEENEKQDINDIKEEINNICEEKNINKEKDKNEIKIINELKDEEKKESFKNVKDVDNDTSECFNINLDKGGNNKTKREETKTDENDNNKDNNNKITDKKENYEPSSNNIEKRKKNKKRKLRNKTKNLRRQREKQNKEKNDNKILDTKNDKSLISNNEEKEIDEEEKSNKDNIINNSNEFSFDINDEKETIIRIDLYDLKNNLKPKEKLQDYFKRMLKYYKMYKNHYFLYDLANNDYYSLQNKFEFKINYEQFPFISNMFNFLLEQLEPVRDTNNKEVYREYQGPDSFGYLIYDKDEYFYVFKNEFNRNLFNYINNVKKYEYDNHYSNRTENDNLDKIDYHFFSSEDFENKINKYFIDLNLKQLPNYFFKLIKKNKKEIVFNKDNNKNEIDMNYVDGNYFSSYIEIDGAFAYLNPTKLTVISENNELFKVSKTIKISSWGDEIKIIDDKEFIIDPNTIILIEDKLSFPKVIKNLTKEKKIKKDELYSSLNFLIFNLIKKINIFNEYLTSISEGKKISYSYYLLLIYDSIIKLNVEKIIQTIIKDLKKEQLIKYPIFQLKVIYILPYIPKNESRRIEKLEDSVQRLKKEMEKLKELLELNKIDYE